MASLELILLGYLAITLIAILLLTSVTRSILKAKDAPPGPWGLPLVGSLLRLNPRKPQQSLRELARRYGPVYQLWMGGVRAVVLAREDIIRTTFAQEGASGRAPLYLTFGIMEGKGLICAEGELWREHRRFTVSVMRALGMRGGAAQAALEERVLQAARGAAEELGSAAVVSCVDPSTALLHSIGNSLNLLVFGMTYERDDPVWLRLQYLLDEGSKLIGVAGAINFLPWLRFLPHYRRTIKFIKENQVESHKVYQDIIDKFEADQKDSKTTKKSDEEADIKHFVDAYLKEVADRGPDLTGTFTATQLHHVAADLFGAGTETSMTTLRWMLLDVADNQRVQELILAEVLLVADGRDHVSTADLPKLVYTQAAMMESQRLHPVVPVGVPHGATKDLFISSYRIPQGTMLIPLLDEVHHDSSNWTNPDQYLPERFLDPNMEQIVRPASFMPFQAGRRVCPGENFARMMLLLYLTQLILHYRILLPRDYSSDGKESNKEDDEKERMLDYRSVGKKSNKEADEKERTPDISSLEGTSRILRRRLQRQLSFVEEGPREEDEDVDESPPVEYSEISGRDTTDKYVCKENKDVQEGSRLLDEDIDDDPFSDPINGFTCCPRPYKLVLITRK